MTLRDPTSALSPSAPSVMGETLPLCYLYILKGTQRLLYQHNYMPPTCLIEQEIGVFELREPGDI